MHLRCLQQHHRPSFWMTRDNQVMTLQSTHINDATASEKLWMQHWTQQYHPQRPAHAVDL